MMEILDDCGWPVSETDVLLLETEIKLGESYIQQAQDLRTAAEKGGEGLERLPKADGDDDDDSGNLSRRQTSQDSKPSSKLKTKTNSSSTKLEQSSPGDAADEHEDDDKSQEKEDHVPNSQTFEVS